VIDGWGRSVKSSLRSKSCVYYGADGERAGRGDQDGRRDDMTHWINTLLIPALVAGALYALVATGFNVLARTTGVLNFAQGNLIAAAPLAVLVCTEKLNLPVLVAFAGGAVMVVALSLLEERIAIRPFIRGRESLPWILSTLGFGIVFAQLQALPFHDQTMRFPWSTGLDPIHIAGIRVTPAQLTTIGAAIVIVVGLLLFYRHTKLGRQLEAVAEDFDGAQAVGIFGSRMSQVAAVMAAFMAIFTGWIVAPTLQVSSSIGLTLTFTGFVATAIGGVGSISGGLAGGMVVGAISQLSAVYIGSGWNNALLFGCLLLVYLVRPMGLFGRPVGRLV
jgi:branched-chain amino acid transport system permease protein